MNLKQKLESRKETLELLDSYIDTTLENTKKEFIGKKVILDDDDDIGVVVDIEYDDYEFYLIVSYPSGESFPVEIEDIEFV